MQRADAHTNGPFPAARMIMDAAASFDATDAIGSVSEHSAQSDSPQLTQEQVLKLSKELNKMQIEGKHPKIDMKSNLSEIQEVLTATPATPASPATPAKAKAQEPKPIVDDDASAKSEVTGTATPKQRMRLTPPPKKQQNFSPSVKSVQSEMHVTIVHVDGHDSVHVVPTDDYNKWKDLVKEVHEFAGAAETFKRPPEVGFIILAKPKICDFFSRGIVTKVRAQDEIAKVEFLEYGFMDIVKFSDMKCLSENLVNACRLVNRIQLTGVANENENAEEIKRFLIGLQENKTDLIAKKLEPIEKTAVSAHFAGALVDFETFTVINEKVKQLVEIEPQPAVQMEEIVEPKDMSTQKDKDVRICSFFFFHKIRYKVLISRLFMFTYCLQSRKSKWSAFRAKTLSCTYSTTVSFISDASGIFSHATVFQIFFRSQILIVCHFF